MAETLGAQKRGAFELKPRPVAVLRGSGSESYGSRQRQGPWPGCPRSNPSSAPCKRSDSYLTSLCFSFLLFRNGGGNNSPYSEGRDEFEVS